MHELRPTSTSPSATRGPIPETAGTRNGASGTSGRILALIPRGEVIRNFVYSGAFDLLTKEADLEIMSVSPGDAVQNMLRDRFGKVHILESVPEPWLLRIQREILDTAHNRWLWTGAARERSRLRDADAKSVRQKAVRTLKKAVSYPVANRVGLRSLSSVERISSRMLSNGKLYVDRLREMSPSLVFNGSHVHSAVADQAVQAAQWLGIPTATFIFSWDNLTSQGRIALPYDYFLVWNTALRDQLLEMYRWIKPENVFVTGTPQFDFHFNESFYQSREDFCSGIGADPARPIVLYTTGMANHMPAEPEIVEEIADMLKGLGHAPAPQLVVRVYPKDRTGRFEKLKNARRDIIFPHVEWESSWHTPKFEDSFALVNALRHCALGINVASTVSLELCMFDKPALNVGYNPRSVNPSDLDYASYYDFDHYRPIVASGAVEVPRTPREMRDLIARALEHPAERSVQRKRLMSEMFGDTLDGRSAERTAQVLLSLAAEN